MSSGFICVMVVMTVIVAFPLWAYWSVMHDEKLRKELFNKTHD